MLPAASIVLLVLSDAFAGPPAAVDAVTPERAGIAHAKEAGMYVDPAVEEMMARAPIGSCANDPTLAKCPSAHAIVLVEPAEVSGPAAPTSGVGTTGGPDLRAARPELARRDRNIGHHGARSSRSQ